MILQKKCIVDSFILKIINPFIGIDRKCFYN